jgi:putative ABC transport system ATP-binding protein
MPNELTTLRGVSLSRAYGEGELRSFALKEVSIDLYAGQIAMLIGPSGSGKSTLLAVLSGLLEPTSGEVLIRREDGRESNLWDLSNKQREQFRLANCGFIFQGYNLFPALTARQQLEIVLRWGFNEGGTSAKRKSEVMLGLLGLSKQANKLPAQLSGGEKQRVAIGRALIKNPTVCFADEPTSALDWTSGENVIQLLRNAAHERKSTVVVVSHDHRIEPFVDVTYNLEDGRLLKVHHSTPASIVPTDATAWRND